MYLSHLLNIIFDKQAQAGPGCQLHLLENRMVHLPFSRRRSWKNSSQKCLRRQRSPHLRRNGFKMSILYAIAVVDDIVCMLTQERAILYAVALSTPNTLLV